MDARSNKYIIEMVRDITIAAVSDSGLMPCDATGENVADFMQEIYNKLVELNDKFT